MNKLDERGSISSALLVWEKDIPIEEFHEKLTFKRF